MVKWAYCRIKCGFDMKYKFSLDKGHFITGEINGYRIIKDSSFPKWCARNR